MNTACRRVGSLIRCVSRFPLLTLAPFSSPSAAYPRLPNSSTDEDEVEEDGRSVYRHALRTQRPTAIEWHPRLQNSASLIGYVNRPLQVYDSRRGFFGAWTFLESEYSHRRFRILMAMRENMARMCMEHLKPNDFIYVWGRLGSWLDGSNLKILALKLHYVNQSAQVPTCREPHGSHWKPYKKPDEPQSKPFQIYGESQLGGETGMDPYDNRLYLWQVFFIRPHDWWDNRKNKKNPRWPDFKHKSTGEALWLSSNDPPWVKRQLELLDLRLAEECEEDVGSHLHSRVFEWVYED